ncbi:MAG: serine protease [Tepidisphaeraceae bacterium]|jgi:S1-C subfamily serine protease
MKQIALLIVASLLLGQCALAENPPSVLNDRSLLDKLSREGGRLIDAKKVVTAADLSAQLEKSAKCKLTVAACPDKPIPDEQFYEAVKPSVVIMGGVYKCDKCNNWHVSPASGYVIGAGGIVVTNYHVIAIGNKDTKQAMFAMTSDGRIFPVKQVLAASKANDVAIVQLEADKAVFKPLPIQGDAPVGSKVRVLSHPDEMLFSLTEGIISRYFVMPARPNSSAGPTMMAITADYAKGSSGGPVLNERGAVVGMVSSTFSVYYDMKDGHQENLQMVIKQCVPAASVLKLIEH